jgi:thiol-disulfide isomerase/thioredoxin
MKTAAQAATVRSRQPSKRPIADESELDPQSEEESEESFTANPFVKEITNIEDLQRDIVSSQRDCVLFLSASYCRTCRTIQPAFTRLARTTLEETANDFDQLLFAKADTSGPTGKELGRALTVASVPTFLLFRKGRQYGSPLSIAKLPSKKLNLAISLLTRGMPWDSAAFAKLEEGGTTKK